MIEGMIVGEVHPPPPRSDALGVIRCDGCGVEFPCHLEAFHSGSDAHGNCGMWSWSPQE